MQPLLCGSLRLKNSRLWNKCFWERPCGQNWISLCGNWKGLMELLLSWKSGASPTFSQIFWMKSFHFKNFPFFLTYSPLSCNLVRIQFFISFSSENWQGCRDYWRTSYVRCSVTSHCPFCHMATLWLFLVYIDDVKLWWTCIAEINV